MHSRRDFLKGVLGSTVVLLAAACAPAAAPAPTTAPAKPTEAPKPAATTAPVGQATPAAASKAPATLQGSKIALLFSTSFVPDEDTWFKETLVNSWAKPNGVNLTIELVATNEVQPKVVAALQAGAGPDAAQMQWNWAYLYADKLQDVSDLADKLGGAGGGWYDVSRANNFVNGTWRAVPWGMAGNAITYRSGWMREGAGTDKFPETWEEYGTIGGQVKQKRNTFVGQALGHSFGDPPTFVFPFLWSYGGSETDESGKRITINSPETEAALKAFKAWYDAASDPQVLSWDDSSNNRAYLASQIWATLNGASIYLSSVKQAPDIAQDTINALNPRGPKGQFVLGWPYSFAIPTYVKDPQPVREMLTWMLDPKNYATYMKAGQGYTLAPYKQGETDALWPSKDPKLDIYKKFAGLSKWYGYPAAPTAAAAESGSKYITVDLFAKVAQGESPQSAMQWAEGELKQVYKL